MAAISASTTDSPIITINASTTINEKLTPSTFPQWRAQFEALLIGYDLIDFVTDKLILHAILASTSTTITPLLAAYKTSHEAWTALNRLYAGKSWMLAMQLKEDLTLSTCGTRTVTEFLHGIKVIADELAIINHPILDDDLTLYILNGLGPKFREIAAPICARETSLKFKEIHDLLVGHESYLLRLENQSQQHLFPLLITLISKKVLLDNINRALSLPPTRLATTIGITKMGPPIQATGNLNRNANGVIKWDTRTKIAQKCLPLTSLQIVQHPPKEKSQVPS
ncbi:Retrovirus-related Pol polyprotein from transposon RE1 [Vitis vinifera]|uniref:Retrovirus-related Pol polyprotein from transposon RE1 n=1 Tax=Vitis vinifera TaxID=29760 RepID=A0A438C6Y8_VITVI|nr:Retrovirus-related Pol polyprotein from transposon RE1 [Vitis vinifera]